ncbi:hypothetical protein G7L40_19815 [Paenibacillus polymyxa]|uniref:DUF3168 domain-containing protein n=1 Tax=Paenibacillus polymyxa TaxID=1406 RepID=A0A378XZI0_PAEPO|nr:MULTISPECIES: hypothetical protein [Paenibacillus]KZE65162.1 hypothetical protein AV545_04360 [Paenibacillus jamilae]MBE7896263.1 hypothetical protein [Paenibacillus polymyxa]MBG9765817.1 hypothetical protein [Paenibacillus polymyxa]MCC3256791.1 hypothetical protein [Paenibacillus polymyxa]QPK54722.1 hypothetical protein G7035_19860 [Paenibacillus polymyxa]
MSRFRELGSLRTKVLEKLISSQELCKALQYDNSNYLNRETIDDPSSLLFNKIYPYNHVPELSSDASSYVTFSFKEYRPTDNLKFKSALLHFQVLVHKDLIRTDYENLRYDDIIAAIDELFNDERILGIGKLEFYRMDEMFVNTNYVGYYLQYKLYEFK